MYNRDDLDFETWRRGLDFLVLRQTGTALDELPDCDFHSWYDDGLTIHEALDEVLRESGWYNITP